MRRQPASSSKGRVVAGLEIGLALASAIALIGFSLAATRTSLFQPVPRPVAAANPQAQSAPAAITLPLPTGHRGAARPAHDKVAHRSSPQRADRAPVEAPVAAAASTTNVTTPAGVSEEAEPGEIGSVPPTSGGGQPTVTHDDDEADAGPPPGDETHDDDQGDEADDDHRRGDPHEEGEHSDPHDDGEHGDPHDDGAQASSGGDEEHSSDDDSQGDQDEDNCDGDHGDHGDELSNHGESHDDDQGDHGDSHEDRAGDEDGDSGGE